MVFQDKTVTFRSLINNTLHSFLSITHNRLYHVFRAFAVAVADCGYVTHPTDRVVYLPEMTDDRSNPRDVRDMLTEYSKKDPLNSFYIFNRHGPSPISRISIVKRCQAIASPAMGLQYQQGISRWTVAGMRAHRPLRLHLGRCSVKVPTQITRRYRQT